MPGGRLRTLAAVVVAAALHACTHGIEEKQSGAGTSTGKFSSIRDTAGCIAMDDSLEAVHRGLREGVPRDLSPHELDSEVAEGIRLVGPDPAGEAPFRARPEPGAGGKRFIWNSDIWRIFRYTKIEFIYGHRRQEGIQFFYPEWLSMGFKSTVSGNAWYVRLKHGGPLETMAIGNLRAEFGEGLLLGRRDPRKTPMCATRRMGDLRISQSLSCWERTKAAAGGLRTGIFHIGGLLWERGEADGDFRQRELWLAASCNGTGWWAGLASGRLLRSAQQPFAAKSPPAALGLSWLWTKRFENPASSRSMQAGISGEAVLLDDEKLFAAALGYRGGSTGWIRTFRQPAASGFGGSTNGLSRIDRILQGSALQWKKRVGAQKIEISFYDGSIKGSARSSRYRSAAIYWQQSVRSHPHIWGISASFIERKKISFSSGELDPQAGIDAWKEERLGLRWDVRADASMSHRLRADLRLSEKGSIRGIAISAGGRLTSRWGEIVFRYANYSFTSPAFGVVSRPGIGPFEQLSFVHGRGSDFSLRAALWICPRFEILAYYGMPWEKEDRLYVAVRYPR